MDMHEFAQRLGKDWQHTSDLIRGAYFFAMRACEFCKTETPGRTRRLTVENVTFRGTNNEVISHDNPNLATRAEFVTICFVDQKNGNRMERRSQRRSGDPVLCPIEAWASVIRRHKEDFPGASGSKLTVCSYRSPDGKSRSEVTAEKVTKLLRKLCATPEAAKRYGFTSEEIGTRSIRSGAAMSLAIQGGHTDEKIRILGRWKSMAFLTYIRPQVLEWSGGMAREMIKTSSFTDLGEPQTRRTSQKSPATGRPQTPSKSVDLLIPRFERFDAPKWQGKEKGGLPRQLEKSGPASLAKTKHTLP
jgi:hypothetical protein